MKRHDFNALISNFKMKKTIGFKKIMDFEKLKTGHVKHLRVITKNRRLVPTAGRIIDTTKNYIENHADPAPPVVIRQLYPVQSFDQKCLAIICVAPPWIA